MTVRAAAKGPAPARDPLAERAAIDAQVAGMTLCDVLARNADVHGDSPALSWKTRGAWTTITWRQYREAVRRAAMGLRGLGVGPGDFVAIMTRNRPEHLIADYAAMHLGATPVSIYNTLAPEQIAYIAQHCSAKVAVVEDPALFERWQKIKPDLPSLERVVLLEGAETYASLEWVCDRAVLVEEATEGMERHPDAFETARQAVTPEMPATLIYTSGTNGPPKGVVITHHNVLWTAASLDRSGSYPTGMRVISYLPLAHALERLASHWVSSWKATHVFFCPEILDVFTYMPEVRPQAFAGVPRLWEKLEAGIVAAVEAEPNPRRRKIALRALDTGRRFARLSRTGERVPAGLRAERAAFDRLVYSKVRTRLGLDACELAVSGAAPISVDTLDFFDGIGIPIAEGYGMTEDSGPATVNTEEARRTGTVGRPMPGVEVRLADDGEVLIRGGNVAPGYFRDPERTAETFDPDGWLHTGDVGEIDADGFLRIVDRKKELIITAGGKNISPANVEALLKRHALIGEACVIGDGRPYVVALLTLDAETAPGWAARNGLPFADLASFSREPRVTQEIQRAVDEANEHVSHAEAVKRFAVLAREWDVAGDELTPTLKLKRRVIAAKYAEDIERLYARP
jgi:long-chain acyl-CoA synthetase